MGNLEGSSFTRDLEIDERGSRNGMLLSEEAQCGRPLGRDPLQGTLEDMLRKPRDKDISPHRGRFMYEGGRES
jgi:hypothetical protein